MHLNANSLNWAIDFVADHSDGDLFPRVLEIEALQKFRKEFIQLIEGHPLTEFPPGPHRRFLVPKDEISYRQATQLDPQDAILLSAIVFQYGEGIEKRRLKADQVFSYRFAPSGQEGLYKQSAAWNEFWSTAAKRSNEYGTVLHCDIADFYNQIYHHTVENQLLESGFANQVTKWVIELLKSTTAGVSRGVPVGPHAMHLIAEATLIPIDNSMLAAGIQFLRYADDIIVFCKSVEEARSTLHKIAEILDKQQRLMLQRHKTKIFDAGGFQKTSAQMIEDRPINKSEDDLLQLIRKYSGGDPYRTISYGKVSDADWKAISKESISKIISEYVDQPEVDYIRLRWFYRRLTQIGHPGAIQISLDRIERLRPCFANICSYLAAVQTVEPKEWLAVGDRLLELLESELVKSNEYFSLSILSLFSRNAHLNHFSKVASRFRQSDPFAKREILLVAMANGAVDWLREHKESYEGMDPWTKSAFIFSIAGLPRDEREYFLKRCSFKRPLEVIVGKWSK